jgi:hypothetical protein
MASFRESWQRCFWCGAWGKCNPGFQPTELIRCRTAEALLCVSCVQKGSPPHSDYLLQVFKQVLHAYTADHMQLADVVAQFAYPICANPNLGFCFHCDPSWVGWTCCVCDFAHGYDASAMQKQPAIEDVSGYEPTWRNSLAVCRGQFGTAEIQRWREQMEILDEVLYL